MNPYFSEHNSGLRGQKIGSAVLLTQFFVLLVQMENLVKFLHCLVGVESWRNFKEVCHIGLPARVNLFMIHSRACRVEAFIDLDVAKECAVFAHEQRIVMPSCAAQCVEHIGPNRFMTLAILSNLLGFDFQDKTYTFHNLSYYLSFLLESIEAACVFCPEFAFGLW